MQCKTINRYGNTYTILYGIFDSAIRIKVFDDKNFATYDIPLSDLEKWKKGDNLDWQIHAIIQRLIKSLDINSINNIFKDVKDIINNME